MTSGESGVADSGGASMGMDSQDLHLSRITTEWNIVFQAHCGSPEQVTEAQTILMMRYAGAVHRYLLAAVRDPDTAADLGQEFAVRFLRGDFHGADPSRGRFRDFLKRCVRNLMIDHQRRQARSRSRPFADGDPEPADPDTGLPDLDVQFLASWRKELIVRTWAALARYQQETKRPYHDVLRLRTDQPDLHSPEMAVQLSAQLGVPLSAGWVRQALHRARDMFASLLIDEVTSSLKEATPETVEQELIDLGLIEYCRAALDKRLGKG